MGASGRYAMRLISLVLGIAGERGAFSAFAPEAGFPALLRKGAVEALGGQLES